MNIEKTIIKKYAELNSDRQIARKGFIKNLITISTGFLALFIGLKSDNIESELGKYFFFVTIILLVCGILFSTISLYLEIYYIDKNQTFLKKLMKEHLEQGVTSDRFNSVKKPIFFKIYDFIGFGSFILSTIALILYVYFLEIY